jgi:hypothetical protein
MIKALFSLLLLLGGAAQAQTNYSYQNPTYRGSLTYGSPSTVHYYFSPLEYCNGYVAANNLTGWTCLNTTVGATTADNGFQTWNYTLHVPGGSDSARSASVPAYCDPSMEGPAKYNGTTLQCRSVAPLCKPGNQAGTIDVTTGWATGPEAGSPVVNRPGGPGPSGNGLPISDFRYCSNGCVIQTTSTYLDSLVCFQSSTPTGSYYRVHCTAPYEQNGSQCTAGSTSADPTVSGGPFPPSGSTPPAPTAPNDGTGKCPAGSVPSGVDSSGTTICVGKTTAPSAPAPTTTSTGPATTTTDANGNTVKTQTSTTTNSDGSTTSTTTTTTTAPDGTVTIKQTSSTGTTGSGQQGTADRPEDKTDLCKLHPELNICKNSQVLGACGEIHCDGDAIQCATLRAAAALECRDKKDRDDLSQSAAGTLGASVLGGSDPSSSSLPSLKNAASVSMPSSLDQSGWLGGGSFFADKTFTVQGHTVTIEFSKFGQYLVVFRYALMVVALLVSFRILSGAVIRE